MIEQTSAQVQLDCGHSQIVSALRVRLANAGHEQKPVYCVQCNDWTRLSPVEKLDNTE
jgi:hypothetical protein